MSFQLPLRAVPRLMDPWRRRLLMGCFGLLWAAWPGAWAADGAGPPVRQTASQLDRIAPYRRVLWVTRWDYRTPADVEKIFYNAASTRFSDVLFQVRGEATAFYRSSHEPWAWELTGAGPSSVGRDPGWDPLANAVAQGHRYGMRVHAYMNVLPGWAQSQPPPLSSGHLYAVCRSWFMVDSRGRRMSPDGWYAFLDPSLSEVRGHLAKVFGEVAARYEVDGIHLDYIRYPNEKGRYSYSDRAVKLFRQTHGESPDTMPRQWDQFRRDQVTATVGAITQAVRAVRPGVEISAAVIADPERQAQACQSARQWLARGLLDAVVPMAYTNREERLEAWCRYYGECDDRGRVWMGLSADPEIGGSLSRQIERAVDYGFGAVAVFAYRNLFPDHRANRRAVSVYNAFVHHEQVHMVAEK